jgi:hypothetical protein
MADRGMLFSAPMVRAILGMGEDELAACCAAMETWHSQSAGEGL